MGSLGFSALAFLNPTGIARLIGKDADVARALGARDLGSGLSLLVSAEPRAAIVQRVLYDIGDAAIFGPARPRVIPWALGFAALGILALVAAPR